MSFSHDGSGDVAEVESTEHISRKQPTPVEKPLKRKAVLANSSTEVSECDFLTVCYCKEHLHHLSHIISSELQLFNGFFRTNWVSRHQKGRTILNFNEARADGVAVASAEPLANLHWMEDPDLFSSDEMK